MHSPMPHVGISTTLLHDMELILFKYHMLMYVPYLLETNYTYNTTYTPHSYIQTSIYRPLLHVGISTTLLHDMELDLVKYHMPMYVSCFLESNDTYDTTCISQSYIQTSMYRPPPHGGMSTTLLHDTS